MDNVPGTQNILFNIGSIIAKRYEVLRLLGNGSMGSVMQVMDKLLDSEVMAMKILFPHLALDVVSFSRFKNEVAVARKLGHPNVVQLYDFGEAGGGYYFITMEYLSGGNLTDEIYTLRREYLNFKEVLRIVREIASGIAYAHSKGIIHRDLKPDNILLDDWREVKIADFGLARLMGVDNSFTSAGETVGTPYYMAPEQLSGDEVDARSDIYSLGLIAYELAVGRRMFLEDNYLQLARQHFNEPVPDFATKESGIPKWYEEFVKKCSAKKPEERFQSAYEIVDLINQKFPQSPSKNTKIPAILSFSASAKDKKEKSFIGKIFGVIFVSIFAVVFTFVYYSTPWVRGKAISLIQNTPVAKYFGNKVNLTEKDLYTAIKLGDVDSLRIFLGAGFDLNLQNENGQSLLHLAIISKQVKVVEALIEVGANIDITDDNKVSPLMLAAKNADSEVVSLLLKHNALTDFKDSDSKTPLIYAVSVNNLSIVEALIRARIDVNVPDNEGKTAIFYAVENPNSEIVEALIAAGAKTDLLDKSKKNPLSYATSKNRKLLKSHVK